MPKFIISFAGAVFREYLLLMDGKLYGPDECHVKGVDSLHIYGTADPLVEHCRREYGLYKDSPDTFKSVIAHEGGHKVLNKFTKD